jgi:hypothetical protein
VLVHRPPQHRPLRHRHRDAEPGEAVLVLRQQEHLGIPRGKDGVEVLALADLEDRPDVGLLGGGVRFLEPAPTPILDGERHGIHAIHEA